jgi:hypothetical protein
VTGAGALKNHFLSERCAGFAQRELNDFSEGRENVGKILSAGDFWGYFFRR